MSTAPHRTATEDDRAKARERKRRERAREKQADAIQFVRTDASLFLHPDRLSQKAGVLKNRLRRMAIKELVDNALDASPTVTLTEVDVDTFIVEDNGPGIDPAKVAELFSVIRPMMSSKLIRRPTRGMVGNGNRVVAGAAFASGGNLVVEARGVLQALSFDRATGDTIVTERRSSVVTTGTRVMLRFGPALPRDVYATRWGDLAIQLAGDAARPMLTYPDWYTEPAFAELVQAAHGASEALADLFGVDLRHAAGGHAQQARPARGKRDMPTLDLLRSLAPKPPKLIPIPDDALPGETKSETLTADVAGATVPAIVQAWAYEFHSPGQTGVNVQVIVNRTPTAAGLIVVPDAGQSWLGRGCGLDERYLIGNVPKGRYSLTVAVTTPAVALISDGKTPDLSPFLDGLVAAVGAALRKAHRPKVRDQSTIKDAACEIMEAAYLKASARGTLPANARQIMYAARPHILERTGRPKLDDNRFTQVLLPDFMDELPDLTADWDVVYDARGHLVEPHTGESIPLGTVQVRDYNRRRPRRDDTALISTYTGLRRTVGPGDRYGAVLFVEKEGFEPLLRAAKIAERFDVAIMSTKGMSVVASRALVDRLSAAGIPILVATDLDASGLGIFGTLGSDSRRYTFTRRPDIRRIGLTLEQAQVMDLQSEHQDCKADADRLETYGATDEEIEFITAGQRVELNAMTSDQFIRWIEKALRDHGVQKVIPPEEMIEQRARQIIARRHIQVEVADLERDARKHAAGVRLPFDLADRMREQFDQDPALPWEEALARVLAG